MTVFYIEDNRRGNDKKNYHYCWIEDGRFRLITDSRGPNTFPYIEFDMPVDMVELDKDGKQKTKRTV